MSPTLVDLLKDPFVWLIVVAGGGLVRFYLEKRITSGVDHRFALRLEDHKQTLQLAAESARYDFERRLANANLYTSKAHVAAVEIYEACRVAHGSCMNLRGLSIDLTFEEFNEADLAEHLTKHEVPRGKQDEILAKLAVDREGAIADMKKYLRMLRAQAADRDLTHARNLTYLKELYFDDEAIGALSRLFDIMNLWMSFISLPPETPDEVKDRPKRKDIDEALVTLHDVLRNRLRTGEDAGSPAEAPALHPAGQ